MLTCTYNSLSRWNVSIKWQIQSLANARYIIAIVWFSPVTTPCESRLHFSTTPASFVLITLRGGHDVEVIHLPAHADGDCGSWLSRQKKTAGVFPHDWRSCKMSVCHAEAQFRIYYRACICSASVCSTWTGKAPVRSLTRASVSTVTDLHPGQRSPRSTGHPTAAPAIMVVLHCRKRDRSHRQTLSP